MEDQANRPHRKTKEKKKSSGGPNPKAFAYAHPGKLQRQAARSHDVKEKRLHVPLVDRLPEEAPPIVVAVVGPPGVGKTTLIKSLIKRYTKHSLSAPTGPLTVVTSKRRRLTFLECPADSLAGMIDVSKVADIVLLMIDGNYGFEMETMEFLNILSSSGMPGNVFGILTHLDLFRKPAALQQAKRRLKHRFWSELYQGAKLFYLSGVINGRYPDREIHNLSRFISVMKNPRPLVWRNSHPYCLVDRFLDITPPTAIEDNPKCDRTVALYGYLRGTNFSANGARVHVPGVGDMDVSSIESLPDPCPTPFMDQAIAKATGKSGRRRLGEKQKLLFAPMSDVGGVLVDKDAVYIDVKTSNFDRTKGDGEDRGFGEKLVMGLQGDRRMLGQDEQGVRLFSGGEELRRFMDSETTGDDGRKVRRHARVLERPGVPDQEDESEVPEMEEGEDDEEEDGSDLSEPVDPRNSKQLMLDGDSDSQADAERVDGDVDFAESDSDLGSDLSIDEAAHINGTEDFESDALDSDEDGGVRWKENLRENAQKLYSSRPTNRAADLAKMMYGGTLSPAEVLRRWRGGQLDGVSGGTANGASHEDNGNDDGFFKKARRDEIPEDRTIPVYDYEELERKWADPDNIEELSKKFASADLLKEQQNGDDEDDNEFSEEDEDGEGDGDGEFEDLETGESYTAPAKSNQGFDTIDAERERNARRKEELKLRFEEEDREGFNNDKTNERQEGVEDKEEFGEDDWYDAQKAQFQKQLTINRAELDDLDARNRVNVEGYRAGTYARIVLDSVPYEFSARFNPRYPIVVGGLLPTEDRFGFVQVRIKRHRWHKKILKTNDPLIFSLGWRRFQTLPVFSISDSRTRNRMLKYTPEHMHCFGTFYGPLIAPNTGFCCVQSFSNKNAGFRVSATGVVLNVDESTEIVKKLKLTGAPYKIFRNTAFIKDMFSSPLEIAKFEGASIRTVSGIRGQIKRALSKPEGHFRATFEDKVLMSDIVFLRAWYPVRPHRFYNPVTNLLDVVEDQDSVDADAWKGMRLTGEVRRDRDLETPQQKNSSYKSIERTPRHFNPIRVSRNVASNLPYSSQITKTRPQAKQTYMQKRAVVAGSEERKARDLLQKLMTLRNEKVAKRKTAQEDRRKVYRKKVAENEEKREGREKRERDDYWRKEGKKRGKGDAGDGGGGGKRIKR